jgi:hypothetical protein
MPHWMSDQRSLQAFMSSDRKAEVLLTTEVILSGGQNYVFNFVFKLLTLFLQILLFLLTLFD